MILQELRSFVFWKKNRNSFPSNGSHPAIAQWLPLFFVVALLATATSCDKGGTAGLNENQVEQETELENSPKESGEPSQFAMQELEHLDSPFTKETVLELNAIVARSLAAINSFDEARKDQDAGVASQLESFNQLSTKAKKAKGDMDVAKERLLTSGEKYNDAIFQAMVRFVDDVDKEIREEIDALSKTPNEQGN